VPVCFTVDVEDWYDGIAELGYPVTTSTTGRVGPSGLEALGRLLGTTPGQTASRVTLFVVGKYANNVRDGLRDLAAAGHELASHGPDHGWPPEDPSRLEDWLRRGRMMIEDLAGCPVEGFRSPRFDIPTSMGLDRYRDILGPRRLHLRIRSALSRLPLACPGIAGLSVERSSTGRRQLPTPTAEAEPEASAPPASAADYSLLSLLRFRCFPSITVVDSFAGCAQAGRRPRSDPDDFSPSLTVSRQYLVPGGRPWALTAISTSDRGGSPDFTARKV